MYYDINRDDKDTAILYLPAGEDFAVMKDVSKGSNTFVASDNLFSDYAD
jgi:hypothetical protein